MFLSWNISMWSEIFHLISILGYPHSEPKRNRCRLHQSPRTEQKRRHWDRRRRTELKLPDFNSFELFFPSFTVRHYWWNDKIHVLRSIYSSIWILNSLINWNKLLDRYNFIINFIFWASMLSWMKFLTFKQLGTNYVNF